VQVNDYVESLNQFAGKLDGVTATNMDALTMPAAAGKDTTAMMIGDYSDGNDGVVLKNATRAGRHQGPPGLSRRAVGLALPAGPRALYRRA
jgi:NitT/TauT family transport system substrate-binding protein